MRRKRAATGFLAILAVSAVLVILLAPLWQGAVHGQEASPFAGRKLVVAIVQDPPLIMKNDRGQWTGFNVDLWRYLAVDLKLNYEFREMSFSEVQKGLDSGEVDVSIAALYETAKRHRTFDFSVPVGTSRLAVAVPAGSDFHPLRKIASIFFSWSVIKSVGLFIAGLFALGALIWWVERRRNPDHFGGHPVEGIGTGTYWASAALAAGTCSDITLKSLPARAIGLLWILIGALAFSAFTASLASSLFSARQMTEIFGEKRLRSMHLGVIKGTEQAALAKKMGGRFTVFDEEEQGLDALRAGKIDGLFIDELALDHYAAQDPDHQLRVHPTDFKPKRYCFSFPKGSELRRVVNVALTEVMEKPEWEALAARYGLDANLEPKPVPLGKRSRLPSK